MTDSLYAAYRRDRDAGMSHAQIASDGVYGALVEEFALRFSIEVAQYADAMQRQSELRSRNELQLTGDGRLIKAGQ